MSQHRLLELCNVVQPNKKTDSSSSKHMPLLRHCSVLVLPYRNSCNLTRHTNHTATHQMQATLAAARLDCAHRPSRLCLATLDFGTMHPNMKHTTTERKSGCQDKMEVLSK